MTIIQIPSPNYTSGRNWQRIKKIVIHWIGAGTAESAANWFKTNTNNISAHYIVGDDTIYQCVQEKDTAHHAGNWACNLESIGIEHEATPTLPMTEATYRTSAKLIKTISDKYGIPLDRDHIIKHKEVKDIYGEGTVTACSGTVDIDKLISLAKGENMDCEQELQEMRESRNYWKSKNEETERTLATEREDHAKEVSRKDEIINQQQQLNARLEREAISKDNEIRILKEEKNALEAKLVALGDKYTADIAEKKDEIANLEQEVIKCHEKIGALNKKIVDLTLWEFIKLKYFGR